MNVNGPYCKSTLVHVMAWCRQATSHYLSQCWTSSLSPYGVIGPQWVKYMLFLHVDNQTKGLNLNNFSFGWSHIKLHGTAILKQNGDIFRQGIEALIALAGPTSRLQSSRGSINLPIWMTTWSQTSPIGCCNSCIWGNSYKEPSLLKKYDVIIIYHFNIMNYP